MLRDFVREFAARMRDRVADPIIGQSAEARVIAQVIDQMEREYEAFLDEELTGVEAALESGYSRQQIALLRKQRIITRRRGDLPRKPGHGVVLPMIEPSSDAELADEVIAARRRSTLRVSSARSSRRVG